MPDLATSVPTPTDNGLTYTFHLKPDIKFAPPVNREITSKDILYAFQRINDAKLVAQYGYYYYGVIQGMTGKATSPDNAHLRDPDAEPDDDRLPPDQADRRLPPADRLAGRRARPARGRQVLQHAGRLRP